MGNIISLFSGCGGLDLGFEQVGDYTTVWANDFKSEACETFRNHFGDIIVEGDIEQIDPYNDPDIPDCDLILGGFPCQDFSIIWKQPGLNGERGNLYNSFLRFVDAKSSISLLVISLSTILRTDLSTSDLFISPLRTASAIPKRACCALDFAGILL